MLPVIPPLTFNIFVILFISLTLLRKYLLDARHIVLVFGGVTALKKTVMILAFVRSVGALILPQKRLHGVV